MRTRAVRAEAVALPGNRAIESFRASVLSRAESDPGGDNDVLMSATTATPTQLRTSFSASLGTTKDARKMGRSLFPGLRELRRSC
jgi:hypothetical protein